MSMILGLRQASDSQLQELLSEPERVEEFVYGEVAQKPPGVSSRLFGTRASPPTIQEQVDETDLDKAWHALHFLLTGFAWEGDPPANLLLAGGVDIGDIDVGYGPARAVNSADVKAFAGHLSRITGKEVAERYSPKALKEAEIYPEIWDEEDALEYVIEYYGILKEFVLETAAKGSGLVLYMT